MCLFTNRRWQFAVRVLWFQRETRVSAELAGALLTLFSAWNVAQHVRRARSKTKSSDTSWSSDKLTFKSINEAHTLTIERSVLYIMAGLIVEILSHCSPYIMLHNGLKMSEYEVHCLTGFPLINSWACAKK